MKYLVMGSIMLLMVHIVTGVCTAQEYDVEVLADAIYAAEGGGKSHHPYGIVSIDTKGDTEYARRICINTIRNNMKRFQAQSQYRDYIEFLGSKYAPVGAANDPNGLNVNWVPNVKSIYNKLLKERGAK